MWQIYANLHQVQNGILLGSMYSSSSVQDHKEVLRPKMQSQR